MLIHYRMLLPIFIQASPILIHVLPILVHWFGFRLSAGYLNALDGHKLSRQPRAPEYPRLSARNQNQVLRHPSCQPIRIEHPRFSAANQNQVLRNPTSQPIRIEHYVTRVPSARLEDPSRLSARYSLSQNMRVFHPPPPLPPPQLTFLPFPMLFPASFETFVSLKVSANFGATSANNSTPTRFVGGTN